MKVSGEKRNSRWFTRLQGAAAVGLALASSIPSYGLQAAGGQAPPVQTDTNAMTQGLPPEPPPNYTQPLYMRDTHVNFAKARGYYPNLIAPYEATSAPAPRFLNSLRLDNLVKGGKIYLSLSDAVLLALENNYDIAIQRLNLDIADTDLLRSKAGSGLLGVNSGLVTGTQGGATSTVSAVGGGPGGTAVGSGGAGAGAGGIALSTNGGGPAPENMDPAITSLIELNHQILPEVNPLFSGGLPSLTQNTNTYNVNYAQGFITGTQLQVGYLNQRQTTNNPYQLYSPNLTTSFTATLTQHLLQGFGWGVNGRFIVQAKNDRRIADSAFRQQLLYTINQVENIYWGLVSAYEDVQSKQRAVAQSTQLESDNEKQLQIGTLAPLDVVNAKSQVASDQQALIASESTLEYQQLVMKQAIARNLDDPALANAPVIPTDRVSLAETPEENTPVDELVRQADANSPAVEQAMLALKNDELTLKGVKNGLLPVLDAGAFYGASAEGGPVSPYCNSALLQAYGFAAGCSGVPPIGYSTVYGNLINSSGPNKGVLFNLNIPIRNRTAQAEQARSTLEYRQAQMRLQQLYVQIKMNVINGQFALTNDRAAVKAALANRDFNQQSLDAELKKLHLGASTSANVMQQQRNLAISVDNVISATAAYARDRAALAQTLASTLDRYGISIGDAVSGNINSQPTIPGLEPAQQQPEAVVPAQKQQLQQQENQAVPEPQTIQAAPMPQQPQR